MPNDKTIAFFLTADQRKLLVPLFEKVNNACPNPFAVADGKVPDNRGVVFAQIWAWGRINCVYVESDTAKRVIDMLFEDNPLPGGG